MGILKRITKKYKSLRFLNRKVTKLSILGIALIGLCISSGYSFAKYRSENYGGGAADAAKFGEVKLTFTPVVIQTPDVMVSKSHFGYYAILANFKVSIGASEVSRLYSLDLKWANKDENEFDTTNLAERTSFTITDTTKYSDLKNESDNYIRENKEENFQWNCGFFNNKTIIDVPFSLLFKETDKIVTDIGSFRKDNISNEEDIKNNNGDKDKITIKYNTYYYSINDGVNNTWYIMNASVTNSTYKDKIFTMHNKEQIGLSSKNYEYSILYFINFGEKESSSFGSENSKLLYNLVVEQEGGEDNE